MTNLLYHRDWDMFNVFHCLCIEVGKINIIKQQFLLRGHGWPIKLVNNFETE